jgi:glycosyltransferase involved in cell wall biosynthesis
MTSAARAGGPHPRALRIGIDAADMVAEHLTGIEYSLSELVRHLPLVDKRHEYVLYFNFVRPEYRARFDARVRPLLSQRVQARVCGVPNVVVEWATRWVRWPIDATLRRCDVVHYPSFQMRPQMHGARVATIHDLMPFTHADQYPPHDVQAFQRLVPDVARRANALIAVSQYTKDSIVELLGIPADRIAVVHHGVAEHFAPATPAAVAELRARLRLPRPFILFVGTAEPRKNLVRLIDAFAELVAAGQHDHDLVLAGKAAWGSASLRERVAVRGLEERVRPRARARATSRR